MMEDEEIKSDMDSSSNEEDEEEENEKDTESSNGESNNNSDSEEEEVTEQTALRHQLKDLSFEELEALKQKMGLKEFNEAMFGNQKGKKEEPPTSHQKAYLKKRKSKGDEDDKPMEVSSKRRVPKLREVVKVPKSVKRDPRFDKSCGDFNDKFWNSEYNFIRDIQKKEAEDYKKKLKTVSDHKEQKQMRRFIQSVSDKEKSIAAKAREAEKREKHKEENLKRVAEGKRPYYLKQSTKKLVDLAEKYDELKATGRLEKYLKKKRKRNAVRDRKSLK